MAFILCDEYRVWREVKVNVPKAGTGFQERTFEVEFRILDNTEIDELAADHAREVEEYFKLSAADRGPAPKDVNHRIQVASVTGWKNLQDQDKQEIPFSAEVLEAMLNRAFIKDGLVEAYRAAATGRRQGN